MKFTLKAGRKGPTRTFTVTNVGSGAGKFHVKNVPDWLEVEPDEFTLAPGKRQKVKVTPTGQPGRQAENLLVEVEGAPRGAPVQKMRVTVQDGSSAGGAGCAWWQGLFAIVIIMSVVLAAATGSFGVIGGLLNPDRAYERVQAELERGNMDAAIDLVRSVPPETVEYADMEQKLAPILDGNMVPVTGHYIDRNPVTNLQFHVYDPASSYLEPDEALLPRALITYYEAEAYCSNIGKHLPTRNEWVQAQNLVNVNPAMWEWTAEQKDGEQVIIVRGDEGAMAPDQRDKSVTFRCVR
jgi:hypothetical protein